MKNILIILYVSVMIHSFAAPVSHSVIYDTTTHVSCSAGDTLKFYGAFAGDYIANIFQNGVIVGNINPTIVSTPPYYMDYYIINGAEDSFTITEISNGISTGTIHIQSTVGIEPYKNQPSFHFYPNPSIENLTITSAKKSSISIYSLTGNKIMTIELNKGENQINIENLPSDIYFIKQEDTIYQFVKQLY